MRELAGFIQIHEATTWLFLGDSAGQIKYAALQLPLKQCLNQSIKANSCQSTSCPHSPSILLLLLLLLVVLFYSKLWPSVAKAFWFTHTHTHTTSCWLIKYAHKFKSRILLPRALPRPLLPTHCEKAKRNGFAFLLFD